MNSLQISPTPGFKSPSVSTASPVGEASLARSDSAPDRTRPDAPSPGSKAPAFNPTGESVSQQVAAARAPTVHATDDRGAKDGRDTKEAEPDKPANAVP